MAITVEQASVGATSSGSTTLATTFSVPVTAGNGIVICAGSSAFETVSSTTDNIGTNAYTKNVEQGATGGAVAAGLYCATSVGGVSTITSTFTGTGTKWLVAFEVRGTITPDAHNNNTSNATSQTTGVITTGQANSVVFVCDHCGSSLTSMPTGYSSSYFNPASPNGAFAAGFQVFTTVQVAINPAFTASAGTAYAAIINAFSSTNTGTPPLQFYPPTIRRKLFLAGPWPFGLPYIPATRVNPPAATPAAPVPPVVSPIPSMMPLFLRLALFRRVPVPQLPTGTVVPTPTPPAPGPGHGKNKPYFRRLSDMTDERRIREIHDKISACLNSLIDKGQLRFQGANQWQLVAVAHTETRNPTTTDDVMQGFSNGSQWVNTVTKKLYFLADNSQNAAVWIGPVG